MLLLKVILAMQNSSQQNIYLAITKKSLRVFRKEGDVQVSSILVAKTPRGINSLIDYLEKT